MVSQQNNPYKPVLSYSLHRLSKREQALFDSYVRIINRHTRHHWQARQEKADLSVFYDDPSLGYEAVELARPYLLVGKQPRSVPARQCLYLPMPIRSEQLEKCLNWLGDCLLGQQVPELDEDGQPSLLPPMHLLHLKRWPPQPLVSSREHLRLATLLTRQPTSLDVLARLSGLPLQTCAAFVGVLEVHGLLHTDVVSAAPAVTTARAVVGSSKAAKQPSTGFFTRLRSRLGLDNAHKKPEKAHH